MGIMRKLRRKSRNEYRVESLLRKRTFPVRKMSEAILDFAEPLLNAVDDDKSFKNIISFATLCWNISLFPEQQQRVQLNNIVDELDKSYHLSRLEIENWVQMLLERKKAFFADDRRIVVSFEVVEERDNQRLLVASVLAND